MAEHKKVCLKLNAEQAVKLEKGTTEFKVYADFECILKGVESNAGYCTKNIKITFLAVILTNLLVLVINLVNQLFFTEVKCCL